MMSTDESGATRKVTDASAQAQARAEAELAATRATLEQQKLLSTNQLQLLKAQQDLITGLMPTFKASGIEGTISADAAAGYPARLVASQALTAAGRAIVDALCEPGESPPLPREARVLIVEAWSAVPSPVAAETLLRQLDAFSTLIATHKREVATVLKQLDVDDGLFKVAGALGSVALALPLIAGAVNAAGTLAGYLRADVEIAGEAFTLNHDQLAAAVSGMLASHVQGVTLAGYLGADTTAGDLEVKLAAIDKGMAEMKRLREQVNAVLVEPEAAGMKAIHGRIADLQKQIDAHHPQQDAPQIAAKRSEIEGLQSKLDAPRLRWQRAARLVAGADALLAEYQAFRIALIAVPEGEARSRLGEGLLAERLQRLHLTHVLSLRVYSSGGQVITRRRFFGGDASFIGGAEVGYVLADIRGQVVASGTLGGLSALDFKPDTVSSPPNRLRSLFGPV